MINSDPGVLRDRVETAQKRFRYEQGPVETGLGDAESDAVGQLRKACRLIAPAKSLRAANGYHTALVELSFGAIERSFEFYREYRTESYYGDRQVRKGEADAMFDLAVATHESLRDHPTDHFDCLCE